MKWTNFLVIALTVCALTTQSQGQSNFLTPGDSILAIDADPVSPQSSYPGGEAPAFALDNDPATKYLNFGGDNVTTGLIFTPSSGATTIQSMSMNTANDDDRRDPATWVVYGTNDTVMSADNGGGISESWTQIAMGDANLPLDRLMGGPVYTFANSIAYSSYKVEFPTLRDNANDCCMQIGDVNVFESNDGTGSVVGMGDPAIAFGELAFSSSYPGPEGPANAIDGTLNKYLNFGRENTGFIVTPSNANPLGGFRLTSANDAPERDPSAWEVYGTNDAIVSGDNTDGNQGENWTLLDSGTVTLPADRDTAGPLVAVNNTDTYSSYKMVFTDVADAAAANSMQVAEVEFFSVVPEPSALFSLLFGGLLLGAFRRRS